MRAIRAERVARAERSQKNPGLFTSSSGAGKAMAVRKQRGLSPVLDPELVEDRAQMPLHGPLAEPQPRGNRLIAVPAGQQLQDAALTWSQAGHRPAAVRRREPPHEPELDRGMQPRHALTRGAHGPEQVL